MVRVLPGGPPDYTSQIMARDAAANDALTRLFYTIMARKEESLRNEQLRRDLQTNQQGFTAGQYELNRQHQLDMLDMRTDPTRTQQPSYLAPKSGGRSMAPSVATPTAPPSKLAPAAPSGGTGGFKPGQVGPNPNRFSSNADPVQLAGSYPSPFEPDESKGETVTISAQTAKPETAPTPRRSQAPVGTTAQPRQSRRPRLTAQGQWGPIDDRYTNAWEAAEQKYNLPRGLLQTMVGVQHNYGRDDGGADGWYRLDPSLKQAWGVTPEMSKDLVAMSDVMGKNMARNRDAYNRYVDQYNKANKTNIPKLGNTAAEVPHYAILNQFGVTNGPRVIIAAHVNPNVPIASQMAPEVGADGKQIDPSRQLVPMGLPPTATGNDLYKNQNGIGHRSAATHQTTIQHQENPPSADDANAPIPRSDVPNADPYAYLQSRGASADVRSLQPDFAERIAASMQDAEAATGQRGSINNAYRSPEEQAQIRANSRGVKVNYRGTVYHPQRGPRGYPAAGPGRSEHGAGTAIDLNRGAVRDYMRRPDQLKKHNLSTIPRDAPHIQMAGTQGPASSRQVPREDRSGGYAPQPEPQVAAAPAPAAPTDPTAGLERTPMFNQKPITQPKTAQVNTFGTTASPPLARMEPGLKGALAGATMAPKMQMAEESPVDTTRTQMAAPVTPTVVPKTAPIPSETTAAAGEPTPQTASTVTQSTQAPPTPTPSPLPNGGYTADDPNESTRLTQAQVDDTGMSLGAMVSGARDFLTRDPKIGTALADKRYTDPQYVESTQGFDESGMEGVDKYVTPEAVPGEGTNAVINWIKQKAAEYTPGHLALPQQREDEFQVLAGRMRDPVSQGYTSQWGTHYTPGYLDPNAAKQLEEQVLQGRIDNPAPATGATYSPGMLNPADIQAQQSQDYAAQQSAAQVQMPPQESGDPGRAGGIPMTTTGSAKRAPLPVEARVVADAMFDVNTEGVPSYGQVAPDSGIPSVPMSATGINSLWDLIKSRGMGTKDQTRATAAPVPADKQMPPTIKVPAVEVLPSGEVLYPPQPPQVVPPKRAPAKETQLPTVEGVNKGPKTLPSGVPPRGKYDPNAKYTRDPNTGKAVIVTEPPVVEGAPVTTEEEEEQ